MTEQNPYQTPATEIGTEEVQKSDTELASPWIRLLAAIIDGLILMIFIIPVQISMGVYDGFPEKMVQPDFLTSMIILIMVMVAYIAINGYTLNKNGQTLGKLICKIKIVRVDFSKVDLSRIIFARYLPITFVGQIPIVGGIVSLVDVLFIFRQSRQCLHDNIADTVVIKA
ncbi:MAG: RDD family protein [Gammaproteobacteria bacterium]